MKSAKAAENRRARLVSGFALILFMAFSLAPLVELVRLGRAEILAAGTQGFGALFSSRNIKALGFTLAEASCSTLAAFAVGLPGAYLVARYRFPGRRLLRAAAAFPFGVPAILVVLAFVLFYGQNGFLNRALMAIFGLSEPPLGFLYSFWGIVLVHGFYEFPIVLETVGNALSIIPRDREEAARILGAGKAKAFATGTLPTLLPSIAEAAGLVFLLTYFSFAVVMVFGGLSGSTLEVEVYRRARIEADPGGAALLSLMETALALVVVIILGLAELRKTEARKAGTRPELDRPRGGSLSALLVYAAFLAVFFLGPILALVAEAFTVRRGLAGVGGSRFGLDNFARLAKSFSGVGGGIQLGGFAKSLADTAISALPAALLSGIGGSLLALGLRSRGPTAKAAVSLPLAVSSIVSGLGWSLIAPKGGLILIIVVEAAAALPFTAKSILGALSTLDRKPVEAARTLGSSRISAALRVDLPAVAPALASAFAFAFASAAGDVNVPLLLGEGDFSPLPLYLYRLTSSYRLPEACAVGVVLGLITSLVFFAKEEPVGHA